MSVDRFAAAIDPTKRAARSMVRRLAIAATSRVLWQLTGVRNLDGTTEALSVEVFPGIGFFARPPAGSKPEAIVVNVGGANAPAAVATRDEQTRKAVADLAEDEAAMFNSTGGVFVKADGTIHARSAGGSAVPLATLADLEALRTYVLNQFSTATGHTHVVSGAATTTTTSVAAPGTPPAVAPPTPAGTSVLRGE